MHILHHMLLTDFLLSVDAQIYDRGLSYYEDGAVQMLSEDEEGSWTALVIGSEEYEVTLQLRGDKYHSSYCTCPYDWGPVCKHQVAVAMAVATQTGEMDFGGGEKKSKTTKKSKKRRQPAFKTLVQQIRDDLDKEALIDFILQMARGNRPFQDAFKLHFADLFNDDPGEFYERMLRGIAAQAQGRGGFIDYRAAQVLERQFSDVFEKAEAALEANDPMTALAIAKAMIAVVPELPEYMDDSDGVVYDMLTGAMEYLAESATAIEAPMQRAALFEYCEKQMQAYWLRDSDMEVTMLGVMAELALDQSMRARLAALVDTQIKKQLAQSHGPGFDFPQLLAIKASLDEQEGEDNAMEKLMDRHLDQPEVRMLKINRLLEAGDLEAAHAFAMEGLGLAEKNSYGICGWLDTLIAIARQRKDAAELQDLLGRYFFECRTDIATYRQLIAAYPASVQAEKSATIISHLLPKQKHLPAYFPEVLLQIWAETKDWESLRDALCNRPYDLSRLQEFANEMMATYPAAFLEAYSEALLVFAARYTGRKYYAALVRSMKWLHSIPECVDQMHHVAKVLRKTYPRRPALHDELSRVYGV